VKHSAAGTKRKRTSKVKTEPVAGGWDVLPHGLGKKEESTLQVKDEDYKEETPPKKKRATSKQKVVEASGHSPKAPKKKVHPYGLTPGYSPFPNHTSPTPEECEEVNKLLSQMHGVITPPSIIPPPSSTVAGCGEVPDLLDALLRTLLSASTTSLNSAAALKGLIDTFGPINKSPNWEAVRQATLADVIESIKKGGLATTKGTNIKKILDVVYERNSERRRALLKARETGQPADIPGAKDEGREQKDMEITSGDQNLLSMDYVFSLDTNDAMDELTRLPGIGVKTASCVILFCMQRPSFAVDTHVWRHCKWLGWVPENASRDKTFSHCEVHIPDHLKYALHQLFIRHGKTCYRCRANTGPGTEEWEQTNCPIEHLVKRTGKMKQPGGRPAKGQNVVGAKKIANGKITKGKALKGRATKGKRVDDETEESDNLMEESDTGTEASDVEMSEDTTESDD
jgi:endonuclease III